MQFDEEVLQYSNQLFGKLQTINQEIISKFKDMVINNQTVIMSLGYNKLSYKLIHQLEQKEWCGALAFNYQDLIMAAGCQLQIKLWQIQNGKLQSMGITLLVHTKQICCLVFSKKENFLVSGSYDATIRCWKQQTETNWICTQTLKQHSDYVQSLILNEKEDQLLSCSWDKSIKVWNYIPNTNIYSISLNETETLLVSCSKDKQINIWGIGKDRKWQFKYVITKNINDYGKRVCFIDQDVIAWQQYKKGITHIFMLQGEVFVEKPELQISLNQESDDNCLFPSIYHKQRKIQIQKYNKYVYIIKRFNSTLFKIEQQPINLDSDYNFGALTADAQYLVTWNDGNCQFRVYQINYD